MTPAKQLNDKEGTVPVRQSLSMKKPSVDFNAIGPDFINKMSAAAAQANAEELEREQQRNGGSGKRSGKLFWNLASSLRSMVNKHFTKKAASSA